MKTVTILHPFTPQAAGVVEESVMSYHSQPHVKAMAELAEQYDYTCSMGYFTPRLLGYSKKESLLTWDFYPVSFSLNGDHKKWKKQTSKVCLKAFKKQTPDVTIINMSAHSSPFSFNLAQTILSQGKQYIPMLGGQHYTYTPACRAYYKHANHILVHTHMQKQSMETMPMFKGLDIRVFPLGVDCTVFKPSHAVTKESNSPTLLYVGRIVEWKRIHIAISAIKHLVDYGFSDAKLNIIGPVSSEKYYSELKELIKDLNIEKHVHFLGHKEHDELPKYFQEATLFTLPSDKETFGMVMIEAMACGTPVVGMDCPGGPADVITSSVNGILATPETYSEAILNILKNEEELQNMSKNAIQKVHEAYSIEATYKALEASVFSIIDK